MYRHREQILLNPSHFHVTSSKLLIWAVPEEDGGQDSDNGKEG